MNLRVGVCSRRRVTVASYEPEYMDAKAPPSASDNGAYGSNLASSSTAAPRPSSRQSWSAYLPCPIECVCVCMYMYKYIYQVFVCVCSFMRACCVRIRTAGVRPMDPGQVSVVWCTRLPGLRVGMGEAGVWSLLLPSPWCALRLAW